MPPYRGERLRNVRVSDELWQEAMATAKELDETLAQVIRRALREYVMQHRPSALS